MMDVIQVRIPTTQSITVLTKAHKQPHTIHSKLRRYVLEQCSAPAVKQTAKQETWQDYAETSVLFVPVVAAWIGFASLQSRKHAVNDAQDVRRDS